MGTSTIKVQCMHCTARYEYRVVLTSGFMGVSVSEKSKEDAANYCPNPSCPSKRKANPPSVFD